MPRREKKIPLAYFITFTTYGTWLHGTGKGSFMKQKVVSGDVPPGRILGDAKRYATRRLRRDGLVDPNRSVWTEDGSKRYLWSYDSLNRAVYYVHREQGDSLKGPVVE